MIRTLPRVTSASTTENDLSSRCCESKIKNQKSRIKNRYESCSDRHHRRLRPLRHGGRDRQGRTEGPHAIRRSFGAVPDWHVARQTRGVPRAPRGRPPPVAVGAELSRKHLRVQ